MGAIVWAYLPNYVCAVLAVMPSQVLARMSRQVRRAREMGSYRLGELIGQGGMGEVYHAQHRLLARPAAIKLIRPERAAGRRRERRGSPRSASGARPRRRRACGRRTRSSSTTSA